MIWLLSANSSLCVIWLSIMASVARSIAGPGALPISHIGLQNPAPLIRLMRLVNSLRGLNLCEFLLPLLCCSHIAWLRFPVLLFKKKKRWIKDHGWKSTTTRVQNWRAYRDVMESKWLSIWASPRSRQGPHLFCVYVNLSNSHFGHFKVSGAAIAVPLPARRVNGRPASVSAL